jgi:hypothetical protein
MRFFAPAREQVRPEAFGHPIFAGLAAHRDLLAAREWPALALLNARLGAARHPYGGCRRYFVAQTGELLADGLHYETRIFRRGEIATRAANWHDLFNALIWIEHPRLKAALNRRQAQDVERWGPKQRSRAQCALTHFDEVGVVVMLDDTAASASALAAWDAHDWRGLFLERRALWQEGQIGVCVFGHALLEHWLWPVWSVLGKALVVLGWNRAKALHELTEAIAAGEALCDPQELRPLPLAGIPGWHSGAQDVAFYREGACFLPKPSGRRYPEPLSLALENSL